MLSGGSPCPVVEHTNTTRGSEIKSAFFSPPEETQKHRSSACVWCYGGRRLPLPASTHHIVGVQGRHPHLQLPPLGLAPDPLGRVLGRARLAAVQHQKAWQRHDGWLGERRSKVTTCQILLFYLIFGVCNGGLFWTSGSQRLESQDPRCCFPHHKGRRPKFIRQK